MERLFYLRHLKWTSGDGQSEMSGRANMAMKTRCAFTLVELLVVMAIIAVLISILLPTLGNMRKSAVRVQCASRHRQIGQAVFMYTSDSDGVLPPAWGTGSPYHTRWNPITKEGYGYYLLTEYIGGAHDYDWPPPVEADGDRRIPAYYVAWTMYNCANVPDNPVWFYLGPNEYGVSGQINYWCSLKGSVPGSDNLIANLPLRFPMFSCYAYGFGSLKFVAGSTHEYTGYAPPGVDWFVGENTVRADGSADWVPGHSSRDKFFLVFGGGSGRWWVVPKFD